MQASEAHACMSYAPSLLLLPLFLLLLLCIWRLRAAVGRKGGWQGAASWVIGRAAKADQRSRG